MLTDRRVAKLEATNRPQKLADSDGLSLHIPAAGEMDGGTKTSRYKFRLGGKKKLLVIGRYLDVPLKAARLARDEAKKVLS